MKLDEIAAHVGAEIQWPMNCKDVNPDITKLAPIDTADAGNLSFIANPDYAKFATMTKASALFVREAYAACAAIQLITPEPYLAFAKTAQLFYKAPAMPSGISQQAYVAVDAKLGENVSVAPFAYVSSKAQIGKNVVLYPGVFVGEGVVIGDDSILLANATVYYGCKIGNRCILHAGVVIGADGFGYAVSKTETVKIPQVGIVVIEDDVEIGANSSVDRAAMGVTKIGRASKLDNHVQIGHNVEIGERCMLSAFVGIAGSTKLGDRITMGGHTGVSGHLRIASDNRVGGMSGVIKNIDTSGGEYIGFPAIPAMQWRRQQVHLRKLGEYEKRIRELEGRLLEVKE